MSNAKAKMSKKTKEEWNDGTLEYWVRQNNLEFFYIIPLFHYSRIILSILVIWHSFGIWILKFGFKPYGPSRFDRDGSFWTNLKATKTANALFVIKK